jgi:hypothetical protein
MVNLLSAPCAHWFFPIQRAFDFPFGHAQLGLDRERSAVYIGAAKARICKTTSETLQDLPANR